jgi:hypothetical protein
MSFLRKAIKKVRSQVQPPMSSEPTSMGNKFERMFGISRQLPRPMPNPLGGIMGGVDFLPGYGEFPRVTLDPDLNPPTSVSPPMRMPSRRPRRLPQIMPERMPSRKPIPNFPNFFSPAIPNNMMAEPSLPMNFMPQDMPMERFPMMRPGFAEGEEVNIDMMMADQAARQGMSPAEQRMMMIQKTAADMGRTISDRDAQLFGMGEISFTEAMSRARPSIDRVSGERNLMQQEQMFFPNQNSLGRELAKLQTGIRAGTETFRDKISDPIMQAIENEKERYSDQMSRGFAAGDEVDVAALPKGLKAMYDSGPKGREGVENIAAKTDKFAEGGAVESEIDAALSDIQSVAPEAQAIGQIMTMVMEMIQSGASEEQVIQALMQMGLDEEDIQQVMMMIAEQMQGQDPIQSQLSQMM